MDLIRVINFAAEKHKYQTRKNDGSPYINHPIGVAYILFNIGDISDYEILSAAILHDTVEDTDTTFDEIETWFGTKIRDIVEEVTDNKSLSKDKRKLQQIQKAPHKSYEAKLVKLADKLHNLTDLLNNPPKGWNKDRVQGYFIWAYKVIEGLRGTNQYIEESLDDIFKCHFKFENSSYPVLPSSDMNLLLEKYIDSMKTSDQD